MTCAKRQVFCELYDHTGVLVSVGSNGCNNPQKVCPRLPGEDYTKCDEICEQEGHAEEMALHFAKLMGKPFLYHGRAVIYGHDRACLPCREKLAASGIMRVEFR